MCGKVTTAENTNTLLTQINKTKSKVIRNVLVDPIKLHCSNIYEEISILIQQNFKKIFMYTPPKPIPWTELKNLSKEERKQVKKRNGLYRIDPKKCNMVFGANAVTRALEKKEVTLVLLADDYKPEFLLKHIIQICNMYNVAVTKVHNLRNISKDCFGFSTIAIAFKNIESTNPVFDVMLMIKNFIQPLNSGKDKEMVQKENVESENLHEDSEREETENKNAHECSEIEILEIAKEDLQIDKLSINEERKQKRKGIILYRDSVDVRVFVPKNVESVPIEKSNDTLDYISLQSSSEDEETYSKKRKKDEEEETSEEDSETDTTEVEAAEKREQKHVKKKEKILNEDVDYISMDKDVTDNVSEEETSLKMIKVSKTKKKLQKETTTEAGRATNGKCSSKNIKKKRKSADVHLKQIKIKRLRKNINRGK